MKSSLSLGECSPKGDLLITRIVRAKVSSDSDSGSSSCDQDDQHEYRQTYLSHTSLLRDTMRYLVHDYVVSASILSVVQDVIVGRRSSVVSGRWSVVRNSNEALALATLTPTLSSLYNKSQLGSHYLCSGRTYCAPRVLYV